LSSIVVRHASSGPRKRCTDAPNGRARGHTADLESWIRDRLSASAEGKRAWQALPLAARRSAMRARANELLPASRAGWFRTAAPSSMLSTLELHALVLVVTRMQRAPAFARAAPVLCELAGPLLAAQASAGHQAASAMCTSLRSWRRFDGWTPCRSTRQRLSI
jgi:hypothetical protein